MANLLLNKLDCRYFFEADVHLKTGLHIGTGKDGDYTDAPVMRTSKGIPYIPGSSVKGILRQAADKVAHLVKSQKESCFLKDGGCSKILEEEYRVEIEKGRIDDDKLNEILEKQCPVCQLFGSQLQRGRITINDTVFEEARTEIRDGVKIEDGVAAYGAKYDYEYVVAGAFGRLRIEAENLSPLHKELIALLMLQLKSGLIRIGGLTSKGFGAIEIKQDCYKSINFNKKLTSEMLQYFKNPNAPVKSKQNWDSFINEVFPLKGD